MTLFLFLIIFTYFDPNIIFANFFSYIIFAVDFVYLLMTNRAKVSKGAIQIFLLFTFVVLSYFLNGGIIQDVIVMGVSFGVYVMAYNLFQTNSSVDKLLKTIMYTGAILALLGLVEFLVPSFSSYLDIFRTAKVDSYIEKGYTRVMATFINPIFFSMVLAPTIFITQYEIFTKRNKAIHLKLFLLIELAVFVILQTSGAIISLFVIEVVYFARSKKIPIIKVLKVLIPAIIAIGIIFVTIYSSTIGIDSLISVFTKRVYAWIGVFRIFKDNFLLGIGPGNFDKYFRIYGSEFLSNYYFVTYNPHSDYFNILVSTGIVGIIVLIMFTLKNIRILAVTLKDNYMTSYTARNLFVLGLLVLYLLIHRSCEDFIFNFRQAILLSAIFGAHESLFKNADREKFEEISDGSENRR